jgi:polyisoprenoid-binding protein YceI
MRPEAVGADSAVTTWTIDPQYATVEFSAKMLFFTVRGSFKDFGGIITLGEEDIRRSSANATIRAASVNTGVKKRDEHLRSKDFLDAATYPEMRFQSATVGRGRDRDMLRVTGTLTIKGRSQEIALDVTVTDRSRSPQGEEILYCAAVAEIDRLAFKVDYAPWLIGRTVKVLIQAQATKQGPS